MTQPETTPDCQPATCTTCGEPIGATLAWPDGDGLEHNRCRDWSLHPFPFEELLDALQECVRKAPNHVVFDVHYLVRVVETLQRAWPASSTQVESVWIEIERVWAGIRQSRLMDQPAAND